MSGVIITEHAYHRAKERLGFDKHAIEKIADKAFSEGIKHGKAKGRLRKYIDSIFFQYRTANNIRVYGENIFLFNGNTLITVYQLPQNLKKLALIKPKC